MSQRQTKFELCLKYNGKVVLTYHSGNHYSPIKILTEKCQLEDHDYYIKEEECSRICLDECHQEYYFPEIKFEMMESKKIAMKDRKITLILKPSSLPKIIVTHLPEMTFMTLFCNFAGLLGIWLGVSMFATMNNFCQIFKHVLAKLHHNM